MIVIGIARVVGIAVVMGFALAVVRDFAIVLMHVALETIGAVCISGAFIAFLAEGAASNQGDETGGEEKRGLVHGVSKVVTGLKFQKLHRVADCRRPKAAGLVQDRLVVNAWGSLLQSDCDLCGGSHFGWCWVRFTQCLRRLA